MGKLVVAVIEWASTRADEPTVFVADSVDGAQRAVAEFLSSGDVAIDDVDEAWHAANPAPDLDDASAVKAWLDALREQATDAWLTLYGAVRDVDGMALFKDVRKV